MMPAALQPRAERCKGEHGVLSRRLRRAINRRAAAEARPIAADAYRRAREALTATATDLLMAGRPLGDVLAELATAE